MVVLPLEAVGSSFGSCQEGSIPSAINGIGHSGWGHLVTVEYAVLLAAEDIERSSPIFVLLHIDSCDGRTFFLPLVDGCCGAPVLLYASCFGLLASASEVEV